MNIVEMKGIKKQFGSLIASDHVNFNLREGEVHALLGENGAGKTTLMRILYGLYKQDEGEVYIAGKSVTINSPKDAIENGIGMVTQHFALVPPMTVAENVVLGYMDDFRLKTTEIEKKVGEAAKEFGIDIDPSALVMHLSVGQRQRVEILKALYRNAKVLILDEPTAVLIPQEVDALFKTLRDLCSRGLAVIFISHKLHEVMEITNRVTVLRDGKCIGTVNTQEKSQAELASMMVGRESFGVKRVEDLSDRIKEPILKVDAISALNEKGLTALNKISLDVYCGEILGVAGVGGNGQRELSEALCGVKDLTEGKIVVDGVDVTGLNPAQFTKHGIGRVPEDRHEGMVGDLTVAENLALEYLNDYTKMGRMDRKAMVVDAEKLIKQFMIKAKPNDRTCNLSGGNMQKVLLARVLSKNPKVVIVPQPTRGLDVGATDYVHEQLLAQKKAGAGVLMISEDLDEVLALSDRIAVLYEGEIVGILNANEATPESLGLLMSGVRKEIV